MTKSGYDFYLDKCLLPVPPGKLQIKINNNNTTVNLINEGEVNIMKKAGLTDIEFECDIPQVRQPYAVYPNGFKDAGYFLDYIERLKTSNKPFQFIVCRKLPSNKQLVNTNMRVSLEDYEILEDAGNGFDLTIKIKLKQWKFYGTKTVSINSASNTVTIEETREISASPMPDTAQNYTVIKGDCLWSIAKRFYGNGSKYTVIYDANKGVIGGNPNLIYPGQNLIIPTL